MVDYLMPSERLTITDKIYIFPIIQIPTNFNTKKAK